MIKTLIIHTEKAWDQALGTYFIDGVDTPKSFPVILIFNAEQDEVEQSVMGLDMPGGAVVTPEMAAKLLANTSLARLSAMPDTIRAELHGVLKVLGKTDVKASLPQTSKSAQKIGKLVAIDQDGNQISLEGLSSTGLKVGDKLAVQGKEFTVNALGISMVAPDPITGQEGIIEIIDEEIQPKESTDITTLPVDPSKFDDPSKKVADMGDPTEHVLDVERAI